jgi:hypothetical protein
MRQPRPKCGSPREAAAILIGDLPTAVEVTAIAPTATPTRAGVRVDARCRIDGIFLNHHGWRRYDHRPANHDGLGNHGSPLLDHDGWRNPVLIGVNFPLVAWTFAIGSYRQIGGQCRRGKD